MKTELKPIEPIRPYGVYGLPDSSCSPLIYGLRDSVFGLAYNDLIRRDDLGITIVMGSMVCTMVSNIGEQYELMSGLSGIIKDEFSEEENFEHDVVGLARFGGNKRRFYALSLRPRERALDLNGLIKQYLFESQKGLEESVQDRPHLTLVKNRHLHSLDQFKLNLMEQVAQDYMQGGLSVVNLGKLIIGQGYSK